MSKAYERLPIEVWKYILDAVIDNTLLLSTNPFEYDWHPLWVLPNWRNDPIFCVGAGPLSGWNSGDTATRQFRSVRGTLRLVCRSWKAFADSAAVQNRQVKLEFPTKIYGEGVRMDDVLLAKRLRVYNAYETPIHDTEGPVMEAVQRGEIFSSEIVLDIGGLLTGQIIGDHPTSFPYLTTLSLSLRGDSETPILPAKLNKILQSLPALRCVLLHSDEEYSFNQDGIFQLPNLRTLSLSCAVTLSDLHLSEWRLPSLTHLRLSGLPLRTSDVSPYGLVDYLRGNGRNLRYLSIRIHNIVETLPPYFQIWLDCPRVRHLEVPFSFLFGGGHFVVPSKHHPLERLINTMNREVTFGVQPPVNAFLGHFARFCLAARKLRCITESHLWANALHYVEPVPRKTDDQGEGEDGWKSPMAASYQLLYVLAHKIEAYGVRFEDASGLSLKEGRERWIQSHDRLKVPVNDPPVLLV